MIAQGLVERLRLKGGARQPGSAGRTGSMGQTDSTGRQDPRRRNPASARPRRRRRRLSRRARLALLATVALGIVLAGAWTWFRDSPLVSVQQVTVTGQSGSDAPQISRSLESAARTMTTLNVQISRLRRAVAPYPVVKDIHVTTQFPHGMRIEVIEQVAVGAVDVGGQKVAVSADGTLLHDVAVSPSLPTIPMNLTPSGSRVTGGGAAQAIRLLSAAPAELLPKISQVTTVAPHGLVAQLRDGPSIYFGDATQLKQKWIAASEVLADSGSAGALYIDVTDPERPAAGAGSGGQSSQGTTGAAGTSGTTGTAGTAGTTATPATGG